MSEEPIVDFKPESLDDVLSEDQPKAVEPKEKVEPKGEAEKPKEDAPPASQNTPEQVPLAALKSERRKRQELEGRLSALEQERTKQARPDPMDDPDGAVAFDRKEMDERDYQNRCSMSQEFMREIHADYDDLELIFMEEAAKNPALSAQLAQHPFPAKFAYAEGQRLSQVKAMGDDPAAYIAGEVQKGVQAALAEIQKSKSDAVKAALPESLAEAPSASQKDVKAWSGPKPLDQLING